MRQLQKGDRVFWKNWVGVVKAVNRTHAYILYVTGTGGHWHRLEELRLVEETKR